MCGRVCGGCLVPIHRRHGRVSREYPHILPPTLANPNPNPNPASTCVSLEPRNGTCGCSAPNARMHSLSANRLLLISAPSCRVLASAACVSAPRSDPVRISHFRMPYAYDIIPKVSESLKTALSVAAVERQDGGIRYHRPPFTLAQPTSSNWADCPGRLGLGLNRPASNVFVREWYRCESRRL